MASIEGTPGWYSKVILALKSNCKWCWGEKRVWFTMKRSDEDVKVWMSPHWVNYPRCGGTGDEPLLGRKPI